MRYLFDDYTLDTQRYELHRAGTRLHLRPKAFQVLAYLLAHRDRVVPKAELLEHVWPNQFIGDATLNSCIMAIRKALGDAGRTPRCLHTVHGQGYRFVAPVEERAPLPADTVPQATPSPAHALHPLASREAGVPMTWEALQPIPDPVGDRVLSESTAPLARARDGEHKQVTVLCGALAEALTRDDRLELETLHHLMQAVVALVHATLQRYDGTLVHVSGEGFLALFGAPVAQEDHARRAVSAALELQQCLRQPDAVRGQPQGVALRLGLHTGPVIIGHLAHDPQRLYPSGGPTIRLAAQLQQQAAPGTLLVSATTYALVQAEVQGEMCATLARDASSPPVPVYAVYGLTQRRAGVPWYGGRPLSRFVGREHELALLHARLAQAVGGQGQVISIAGEPGMGKSRLLAEFAHRLHGQPMTYCAGHCLAYGSATPYLPVLELLRQLCGITATDRPPDITAKVVHALREVEIAAEDAAPVLLQLLDVPNAPSSPGQLSPSDFKAQAFALLRQLSLYSGPQPLRILAVEDLHWIDPTSEEWLASLVEQMAGTALLLVVTYRPGHRPPWLAHSAATQLALTPLTPRESLAVVQAVPQAGQLSAHVQQAIVTTAAGNPFFLEELTWAAVDAGTPVTGLLVPETIQAVLAMRIDRLLPVDKYVLQTAAVIGKEVPVPLLQAVMALPETALHTSLGRLQASECLYETRLVPTRAYTFKHALLQEVAYGSLLQDQRRPLHSRIVAALEQLAPDQAAEHVERLAHHALRGEVWDKAVTYCQQAGARAHDRAAFREAVSSFEQALQALAHLPKDGDTRRLALELRLALAWVLNALGELGRRLALLGEAEALARALDDRASLAQVLASMGHVRRLTGDFDGAITASQQALDLAVALGDRALQMLASHTLGQACYAIGDFSRAAELYWRNVEGADRESGTPRTGVRIASQAWLARTLSMLGAFAESRRHGEEALRLATLDGRGEIPVMVRTCLGLLYLNKGDLEHAIRVLEQGLALCRASGHRNDLRPIAAGLGYAYALQGCLAEGRVLLEEGISVSLRTGALLNHALWVAWLSEVCRLAGRGEEAGQHAREALGLARQQKERGNEALALHQLGAVHAHTDPSDAEQAEAYYQQALALAEALGMRPLQAHCHLGLGTLYAKAGQPEQARTALSTAVALYRTMDMTFWLPQAEAALAQVEGQ